MIVQLGLLNGNMGYHQERFGTIMDEIPDRIKKLEQSVKNVKESSHSEKSRLGISYHL